MMTEKQRAWFFRDLWPKACRAQRWTGKAEDQRRAVVRKVTGGRTDSMTACSQTELTAVFNHVKWLANPADLDLAQAAANPEVEAAKDECRRLIWKIRECGFADAYVQEIAAWDCRECQVAHWTDLPADKFAGESRQPGDSYGDRRASDKPGLRRVLIHLNKRRLQKGAPLVTPPGPMNGTRDYVLKARAA